MTIFQDNAALEPYQTILKGDELTFQCVGQSSGDSFGGNVYWSIERNDEMQTIREEVDSMLISASFGYNYANLVVRDQFVGSITCLDSNLGLQETVIVADSKQKHVNKYIYIYIYIYNCFVHFVAL